MPELRKDPVMGRWVIIATERAQRPSDFQKDPEPPATPAPCAFCPGQEEKTPPEILAYREAGTPRNKPGWWCRVVPNKYPALRIEGTAQRQGYGIYDRMDGTGAHEVIVETPDHSAGIDAMPDKQVEEMLWAYRDRIMDLKKDPRFEYILIFKNHGYAAGASLSHPHSQLIALPMVPVRVQQEIAGARTYYQFRERCIFCDVIQQELSEKVRIVLENDSFVCLAPYASRFPFETWILPKVHDSVYEDIQRQDVTQLARMLKQLIGGMNRCLGGPAFNWMLHNSPLKDGHLPHYHWHLEVIPKLSRIAGFEWGTGFYINPMPPEDAAKHLRECVFR